MQRALLIMLVAMSMIPAGDSAGKLLTSVHGVSPLFVAWSRFLLGGLLVLPFVPAQTRILFRMPAIWFRAALLAGGITSIQTALQTADVATVFAAFFIGPLFSFLLAVLFLGERATAPRSILMGLGFLGVLCVVRPGLDTEPGLLWALLAGLFYGAFLTMSRALSGVGAPLSLVFSQLAISALLLLPLGLMHLPQPDTTIATLTLLSALFSMLGNLLLLYAYRIASATQMAPLVYFQLIAAVLLGWAIFGNLPDGFTWMGLGLIIGTGLISSRLRNPIPLRTDRG